MKKINHEMALFRYKIIAPALVDNTIKQKKYFEKISKQEFKLPNGESKQFKPQTFKKWLLIYRKDGFDGLLSTGRSDKGTSRKISDEQLEKIKSLVSIHEFRTAKNLYEYMLKEDILGNKSFTYATLNSLLNKHNLKKYIPCQKERKAFETEHIHSLWMVDFMYGPYVHKGRIKFRSYLCAIIDDYSRYIVGAQFYDTQSNFAFEHCLKNAIAIYGLPNRLYSDNGKVFLQGHMQKAAAKAGFILIHSKPYDPSSRGKIERYYRTVRDTFIPFYEIEHPKSERTLDNLNASFRKWLDKYHNKLHRGINEEPYKRYMNGRNNTKIRTLSSQAIKEAFMHCITRKVGLDSTILINKKRYEVSSRFIGKNIEIRFSIEQPGVYNVYVNDKYVEKAVKLNKQLNSNNPIRFNSEDY